MREVKTCSRCKKEQPVEEFSVSKTGKGGRRETCKTCVNRYLNHRVSGWRGPSVRLPSHVSRSIGL